MRLQDIMTTEIETIQAVESAEQAWNRMFLADIHHLIVKQGTEVLGIISERDLGGKHGKEVRLNKTVGELMTASPVLASPTMTVKEAANAFRGYTISALPVMEDAELVGIVTITDLLELIGKGFDRGAFKKDRRPESGRPIYRRSGLPQVT